jgi:pimeloyl-ACP methyl ester carboxylesterase
MFGHRNIAPPKPENPTTHFGWRKLYDPFTENNLPSEVDTIINYTQRRYLWIDHWLMRNFNIDPARIHIHGHSMGSAGATALAKAYPDHYASATIFNNGFGGPGEGNNNAAIFGSSSQNFPTNLIKRSGENVRLLDLFDIKTNTSSPGLAGIPFISWQKR